MARPILAEFETLSDEQRAMAERYHELMNARHVLDHLQPGLLRYFILRIKPGGFLCAVLANDLSGAVSRAADALTFVGLRCLVMFLNAHAPGTSWGSTERVDRWLADPYELVPPTD